MGGTDGARAAYLAEKNELLSERVSDLETTLEQKDDRIEELEAENQRFEKHCLLVKTNSSVSISSLISKRMVRLLQVKETL